MSDLLLLAIPLAALTAALLALPLWRRGNVAATRADFDLAVFRDQLAEIDRDVERGLLEAKQAEAARIEVERRILAVASATERGAKASPAARRIVLAAAAAAPVAALLVYLGIGEPGMPDFPLAGRDLAREAPARGPAEAHLREGIPNLDEALVRLEERLRREPDDAQGWQMLGRTYMALEKYPDAAAAFARAHVLDRDPRTATQEGEALIFANNRVVPPLALKIFLAVLEQDPREPRARYYIGLAKAQSGDLRGAAQDWTDLIALAPADAEWTPTVREQIEGVAKELGVKSDRFAPSAAARALLGGAPPASAPAPSAPAPPPPAAAVPAGQEEMIRGMVERLAGRLKDNPDDAEGWRMLARSYEVLGETDKAKEARAKAEALARKQER